MNKRFELLPPLMPNFISYKVPPGERQEGVKFGNSIPVKELTKQEAEEYGELMKQAFIEHWMGKAKGAKVD